MSDALRDLAVRVGAVLRERGRRLATAESCTGGWIAKVVTDIAGSSAWFERGFVTYSNAAKAELLGVHETALTEHGAVSGETVTAMAEGALARSRADTALAVSGIAGPGGGTPDKPVGTVWIAWSTKGGATRCRRYAFGGDRKAVRRQSAVAALEGLLDVLRET